MGAADLFFYLAKILGWFAVPLHALVAVQLVALLLLWKGWRRAGLALLAATLAVMLAVTFTPLPQLALRALEQRYPIPQLPAKADGILLLCGGQSPRLTHAYGQPHMTGSAERMFAFTMLARRYPDARLVVSGGSGLLRGDPMSEADVVRLYLEQQGVDLGRALFETKSRNTLENAKLARQLVSPRSGETWILVTSAHHMPRAAAVFAKAGWPVLPYPTGFRALPEGWDSAFEAERQFQLLHLATRELLGLLAYSVVGGL